MSKELEALKRIDEKNYLTEREHREFYSIVEQALLELKAIKEAEPNKALKNLEVLDKIISPLLEPILIEYEDDLSDKITANYFALKQALLKAQEQEKVLEIIKKKTVGIFQLKCCKNVDEYNDLKFNEFEYLTEEEFNTLKRYFEKNIQNR